MNGNFVGLSHIHEELYIKKVLHALKNEVRAFVNKYDTDNTIYGLVDNQPKILEEGYMVVGKTFKDLEEALDSMNSTGQCIQILGRENVDRVYRVGTLISLSDISQHKGNTIVNINTLSVL